MKKVLALLIFLILVIGLSGCKKNEEKPTLKIGLMPSLLSVPYYYAEENDLFEKYGVNVELNLYRSAKNRDLAFKGEHINAVSTDLLAALLYLESGKDIVITSQTEEEFRLVAHKNFGFDALGDVNENIKVGISENTVVEYLVDHVMEENNIDDYTKQGIAAVPDRYTLLKEEDIDMAIMPEPFPSLIMADDGKELWNNVSEDLYATCFVVEKDFAEANYEMIKGMNQAINEAIELMMGGDYEDYHDIITNPDHTLIPADSIDLVNEQIFHPIEDPKQETFADVLEWAQDKNLVTEDYRLEDILFPYTLENLNSHQ